MRIDGENGYLSPEEISATGLPSPVPLANIDATDLLDQLDERRKGLEAMKAADDDELTHAERASIGPEQYNLASDRRITEELIGQLMAHQVELFLLSDN